MHSLSTINGVVDLLSMQMNWVDTALSRRGYTKSPCVQDCIKIDY